MLYSSIHSSICSEDIRNEYKKLKKEMKEGDRKKSEDENRKNADGDSKQSDKLKQAKGWLINFPKWITIIYGRSPFHHLHI